MGNRDVNWDQYFETRLAEIASLLLAGQKLNAIKVYREVTGASLAEAKGAVERLELVIRLQGAPLNANALSEPALLAGAANAQTASALLLKMALLISQNQKIQAIKLFRQHTGKGLADAKNVADRIEQMMRGRRL